MAVKLYALGQRGGETYDGAGKGIRDIYNLIHKRGFVTIPGIPKHWKKCFKIFDIPFLLLYILLRVRKDDYIFFCIPENVLKIKLLKAVSKIKRYKTICFINDLNAFRYGNTEFPYVQEKMREEAATVGMADYVLLPNMNTKKLLENFGIKSIFIPVNIWDYLTSGNEEAVALARNREDTAPYRIAFAGNLNKSEFLVKGNWTDGGGFTLELWGKIDEEKKNKFPLAAVYHGVLSSEEMPEAIRGCDFGLVWDGTGADEIEGGLGNYLQYNNSHKCGLYLTAGIPVIVWNKSGMADFIMQNGCGIGINRLSEIMDKIRLADYDKLKENAVRVGARLREGYYFKLALETALSEDK